jgi:biotin transport system permease protein
VLVGAYSPGTSPVHRAPAAAKLVALGAGLVALTVWRSPAGVGGAAAVVTALAAASGVGPGLLWHQVRPVLWFVAFVVPLQVWLAGAQAALVVAGSLVVAVAAAGLVTLTTRTQELLDALVRGLGPLRPLGVRPERVALVLALAVRTVPVLAGLARQVGEARAARGAGRSVRAFAVPLLIRSLRHADRLGEALAARGVDDDPADDRGRTS